MNYLQDTANRLDNKAKLSASEQEELDGYLSEVVSTSTQFGVGHNDPEDNTDWLLR
ncbi:MAG: hypothetical protein REI94_00710 [Moraxellaceae bacterium]|nr:hypothetical protein [Moraxellaceae bacterium]